MSAFDESIIARAMEKGIIDIKCHQIRTYTENKQGKVDDYPYGGGPGLIMAYQPVRSAYDFVCENYAKDGAKPYTVYMSPQGTPYTQKVAKRLSEKEHIVIICGHYEGLDERVIEDIVDEEISLGDFVLTGGEIPAMAIADSVSRLVPGVLASKEATELESHTDILLEYPQYTRPETVAGRSVPDVLLKGNHGDIEKWRLDEAVSRTKRKRPDLYKQYIQRERNNTVIYLDNSATTMPLPEVCEEMADTAYWFFGNPSSLHGLGFDAEKKMRDVRKIISDSIGASEKELHFTSGATEANNWVFKGICPANARKGKHILISAVEHPSVKNAAKAMEAYGYTVETIPVNSLGIVEPETVKNMVREDTVIVSVMHVNSETGAVQPIKEIAAAARSVKPDVLIHSDCVQSYCKIPVKPSELGADMISVSAHKFHGPRGIGFLYVRKGIKINPLLDGGGQEDGLRSGTENLAGMAGFAKAVSNILPELEANYARISEIKQIFTDKITDNIHTHVFAGENDRNSPYILNVSFPGLRAEVILHSLEARNVYVSVGSACSSHKKDRSPVLTAMGYKNIVIDGAIRISFSPLTTKEQAEAGAAILVQEVKKLYAQTKRSR